MSVAAPIKKSAEHSSSTVTPSGYLRTRRESFNASPLEPVISDQLITGSWRGKISDGGRCQGVIQPRAQRLALTILKELQAVSDRRVSQSEGNVRAVDSSAGRLAGSEARPGYALAGKGVRPGAVRQRVRSISAVRHARPATRRRSRGQQNLVGR